MKAIITIIILALLAWGAYALWGGDNTQPLTPAANQEENQNTNTNNSTATSVKEFTVVGRPFSFSPSTIQVNEGDTVRITFQNQAGTHDWVIDDFNARTSVISAGQSETIEFVASRKGSFEYYCSVADHREMGMVGTLVVQ